MSDKPSMWMDLTYDLSLQEQADGWVLGRGSSQFGKVMGIDFADLPKDLRAGVIGGFAQLPDISILSDGTFSGPADFDGYVATLPDTLSKLGIEGSFLKSVMAIAKTPQFRANMEQKMGDPWRAWVESWAWLDGVPGDEWSFSQPMEVFPGTVLDVDAHLQFHGFVEKPAGHVLLSGVVSMGDDVDALLGVMSGVMEAVDLSMPANADDEVAGMSFTSVTHIVLVTDPETLIPHRATTERLIRVSDRSGKRVTRREAKQWRFTVPPAGDASPGGR